MQGTVSIIAKNRMLYDKFNFMLRILMVSYDLSYFKTGKFVKNQKNEYSIIRLWPDGP
jgi:hypothetical protein